MRLGLLCAVLALALLNAACQDSASKVALDPSASAVDVVKIERVAGANIAAAPLALVSLDGPPQPAVDALWAGLQREAATRQIELREVKGAKYLARGYFSAFTIGETTHFVYVWDVADSAKHGTQRVTDEVVVKGVSSDPWGVFFAETVGQLAARSADDLAAVLSNVPEAGKTR